MGQKKKKVKLINVNLNVKTHNAIGKWSFAKPVNTFWSGRSYKTLAWESSIFQSQRISFRAWDSKNKLSYKVKNFNVE